MERKKIIVPKGIRYVGEKNEQDEYKWKDFGLDFCEKPYILNKILTGCGFTEYCLTNGMDIVLISPRRFLLENKEEQHEGDVYYFRNDNEVSIDFELDVDKDDKRAINEKAKESEESKNKTLENLERIKNELRKAYVKFKDENPRKPFKILVTYDSFKHVKSVLANIYSEDDETMTAKDATIKKRGNVIQDFFMVVDEFQSIFIDARFKSDSEINLLRELRDISRLCFVSATPMLDKYLEMLDEFKNLPYYELDWATEEPERVKSPSISIKFTRSLNEEAKAIIDSYKNEKFEIRSNPITDVPIESKEAVLFFNSVAGICQVIRTNKLHIEDCNIICSKSTKNGNALKRAFNDVLKKENPGLLNPPKVPVGYNVIGKIPTKGEPHKMFTFCTRTVYLGADFYSTNARSFVFCDANIDCLSVDISMDLEQILGRQRLKENPWKDSAKVFIRTVSKDNVTTAEQFNKRLKLKINKTKSLLTTYEDVSDYIRRKDLAEAYLKLASTFHYKDNYVSVTVERDWTSEKKEIVKMTPVFNNLMMISDMRAFEVQQVDYKDRFSVFNAIDNKGLEGSTERARELATEFNAFKETSQKLRFLVYKVSEDSSLTEKDIDSFLDLISDLKYKDYYKKAGPGLIKSSGYVESELKKLWKIQSANKNVEEDVVTRIFNVFLSGKKYTNKDAKDMLKNIYSEFGYSKTAKTTDLEKLFIIKSTKLLDSSGKWVHGIEIVKERNLIEKFD